MAWKWIGLGYKGMIYDKQILKVLSRVSEEGICVRMLAKHVYNMNCNLFEIPDIIEIHRYVQQYLLRNSKSAQSLVESTGRRGFYRLNTANSPVARQLFLDFHEAEEEQPQQEKPVEDLSLSLF